MLVRVDSLPARWGALSLVLAVVAISGLLLFPLPVIEPMLRRPALFQELENLGHPIAFMTLALVAQSVANRQLPGTRFAHRAIIASALCAFAVVTEGLQLFTPRDASLHDLAGNALGIGAGILWPMRHRAARPGAVLLLLVACLPLLWTLAAYSYRQMHFPIIWEADSRLLNRFARWQGGEYPGLVIEEVPPDWSEYESLQITVHNTSGSSAAFAVRVHDTHHSEQYDDRYNKGFSVAPGEMGTIVIPLGDILHAPVDRNLDMKSVAGVVVFQGASEATAGFKTLRVSLN